MKTKKTIGGRFAPIVVVLAGISYWTHAFSTTIPQFPATFGVDRPSVARSAAFIDGDVNGSSTLTVNGASSGADRPITAFEIGLVSSYHLLYPESFPTSTTPFEQKLPLSSCLQLLRKAIKSSIIRHAGKQSALEPSNTILRIEQKISHVIDPLCWLQAQKKLNIHQQYPSLYFATAEGTLEAAGLGSSLTYSGTAEDDEYWNIVERLPPSSHLYGGQRFDAESPISEEWKDFSKGFWMLPAVEIRIERAENNVETTTIAVHIVKDGDSSFLQSARRVLDILSVLTDDSTYMSPPTTLPPILSRTSNYGPNLDGQEIYEKGVTAALQHLDRAESGLKKVVLARRMDLSFARHASGNVDALDVLRKWKFGSQPGGHTFYLHPGGTSSGEFFGCTPERLFRVRNDSVLSEALAGTRPRGSTHDADAALARQLFESTKDQTENLITGNFIRDAISEIESEGYLCTPPSINGTDAVGGDFFVRRLRHLQHICQRYECSVAPDARVVDATRRLLSKLHPTPAVGGYPKAPAMKFIREYESVGFDRGFYSGPVGFVGRDAAEIVVAIRSGLLTRTSDRPKLSVYGGAGIVPGSTVQGEWAETAYKLAVVSSIFPQSPITLQSASTPNVAWATAFVEELIRNGVTQFYICPGSRSTPLVAAIAKAVRSYVGVVQATSIHDERGAGFRAVGYGRGCGRPAVVVTSSGTAVANLYPAIVEAGVDGIPMIVLTADRPYENRNTGANQAIDQVKMFSGSYLRWFRDFLPPSDDVPVSAALADAAHGVTLSKTLRGPVHLNVQFRENLAPDAGPIRNDDRTGAITKYDAMRFTESPGFQTWSLGGGQWQLRYTQEMKLRSRAVSDIGNLIANSKRGIIVVGNLRKSSSAEDISQTVELISSFARTIGFPVFASALSGTLRFESDCVVPFAEHILRCPVIQDNLQPDLVLQLGAPLVSTEIPKIIKATMRDDPVNHVLVHPHHSDERADPEFTVSHNVDADIGAFVTALSALFDKVHTYQVGSALSPLVGLGRVLQEQMPRIVEEAAGEVKNKEGDEKSLSEPELFMAMSKLLSSSGTPELSLFLSNSMPIRDAEAFLYPASGYGSYNGCLKVTGVNRGASGIDGIIASAAGFADATKRATTLLIGDVATLHDLNSFHGLRGNLAANDANAHKRYPLTSIVLNNDGGGIFSFLPISNHGADVSFEEFFGTPTNSFSFEKGAQAFGLSYNKAFDTASFETYYSSALRSGEDSLIEAIVLPRDQNVRIHKEITRQVNDFINTFLGGKNSRKKMNHLSLKTHCVVSDAKNILKTLVFLHGWMGDKSDWDDISAGVLRYLGEDWRIVSVDLPGHGESELQYSSTIQSVRSCLRLDSPEEANMEASGLGIDSMAEAVHKTLEDFGLTKIDAIAGYSLGGRVALAMKRSSLVVETTKATTGLISEETKIVLLSTYPGELRPDVDEGGAKGGRLQKDEELASKITALSDRSAFLSNQGASALAWSDFLNGWYDSPIWGSVKKNTKYEKLVERRSESLSRRGKDIAAVLRECSPPRCRSDDWRGVEPSNTLVVAGSLDKKYSNLAREWLGLAPNLNSQIITEVGHALLVEAPDQVSLAISDFLRTEFTGESRGSVSSKGKQDESKLLEMDLEGISGFASNLATDALESSCNLESCTTVASLDYERFVIDFSDERNRKSGVSGIGWGQKAEARDTTKQRKGLIIQVMSADGLYVGVGEVSPLEGLHDESLEEAELQLQEIAQKISNIRSESAFSFDAARVLSLDGSLGLHLDRLTDSIGVDTLYKSVRSGLEMTFLSLASQVMHSPLHQALLESSPAAYRAPKAGATLALNGLITRGSAPAQIALDQVSGQRTRPVQYESWKVKVGHQSAYDDAMAISYAYQVATSNARETTEGKIRADANRGFNETTAINFANILKGVDSDAFSRLEYVEEPLEKQGLVASQWTLARQIRALEEWHEASGIQYSLDESISDLAEFHGYDLDAMKMDLKENLSGTKGCAALVLKPSLLGLELSLGLARFARKDLGIGAVFTSSFDSGVGLAFASFLAGLSDTSPAANTAKQYSHGLGTFSLLADDCISPSFGSYVNQEGKLNVASLSRAFYGLGLDEIRCLAIDPLPSPQLSSQVRPVGSNEGKAFLRANIESDEFEASTATSSDGREINVVASLPLPFSAEVACARFTDLPQQPRWSPWISSVAYVDARSETEWTLRVRGVNFRWRAKSSLLKEPYLGIRWESVSGLKNTGAVEFIPTDYSTCLMKVQIAFVTPRILSPLFQGTSVFFEDFLRNKVLKWSLEMFRDVVKGDICIESGDLELGDALFGAVEGKANAIEATFSNPIDKDG